jgi:hypothetical protein
VQVYEIIFLVWAIVFGLWYMKQVSAHNKRWDEADEAANRDQS